MKVSFDYPYKITCNNCPLIFDNFYNKQQCVLLNKEIEDINFKTMCPLEQE